MLCDECCAHMHREISTLEGKTVNMMAYGCNGDGCDYSLRQRLDNYSLEQNKTEWIRVKDRLPEPYIYVLVYAPDKGKGASTTSIASISLSRQIKGTWKMLSDDLESNAVAIGDLKWHMSSEEITHWMPLPNPP